MNDPWIYILREFNAMVFVMKSGACLLPRGISILILNIVDATCPCLEPSEADENASGAEARVLGEAVSAHGAPARRTCARMPGVPSYLTACDILVKRWNFC